MPQGNTNSPEETIMKFLPGRGHDEAPWEPGGVPVPNWIFGLENQGLHWGSTGLYVRMLGFLQQDMTMDLRAQSELSGDCLEDIHDWFSQLQNFGLIEKVGTGEFVIHLLPDLDNDSHAAAVQLTNSSKESGK